MNIQKFPIKVVFHKGGDMIYFSQLDLIHVLERALRRTDLPIYFTQGFNPRVKISFSSGLKLGMEGKIETTLYFTENISFEMLDQKLSAQLPQGLTLKK
jgi:radical SAM-linked protein